jgi:hypothetical protein
LPAKLAKSVAGVAMIECVSCPVALRQAARVTRVSPPSVEKRSMITLVSLTKPGRLSAEIAMLPRNDCWL